MDSRKLQVFAAAFILAMVAVCMMAVPALAYTPTIADGGALMVSVGSQVETEEVYYKYGTNASVTYVSSDTSVATVSGDRKGTASVSINGWTKKSEFHYTLVTAVGPGSATITATDSTGVVGTYRISVPKYSVTAPICKSSSVYTGAEVVFLSSTSEYSIEGGSAVDAGSYTATATLNNTNTHQWADGTTAPKVFTYEITKAGSSMTAKAQKATLKLKTSKKQYNNIKVSGASGRVTFKSATSKVKVSSAGKVTIPKGFKGAVKLYVTDKGDSNHNEKTVTVKFSVKK